MAKFIQLELSFAGVMSPASAPRVCTGEGISPAIQCAADTVSPAMKCAAGGVVSDTCADYDAMALRQGIDLKPNGPCKSCPLQGLCDTDDCAMKCFKLDSGRKDQGSWDRYFERQRAQVRCWLDSHTLTL